MAVNIKKIRLIDDTANRNENNEKGKMCSSLNLLEIINKGKK